MTPSARSHSAPSGRSGPVLLTGVTGFIGMELLVRLLENTERRVLALIRAPGQEDADSRLRTTLAGLFDDPERHADRVQALCGDLTARGLGLDLPSRALAQSAEDIIHGAASVSFTLPLDESREINVEGTRRMLELAGCCESLRRFTYVSTAYVAGHRRGRVTEEHGPRPATGPRRVVQERLGRPVPHRFRNAYERSKCEAEALVHAQRERLPVTVARPSIVVGDRACGWTSSFNVLYAPLRAFQSGAFPILPARRRSRVDVVSVDYVADAVLALSAAPQAEGRTFHLVAGEHDSTVGELIDLASERFERRPPTVVPPPLYGALLRRLELRRSPGAARLLRRNEAYFPYLGMRMRFDDTGAREVLEPLGIRASPLPEYFDRLVEFAQAARWGRRPIGRADARLLAGLPPARTARPALRSPSLGRAAVPER